MDRKLFVFATAMAIVFFIVAGFGLAPVASAQGPDEFVLTVTLPRGETYQYPMLPNEWVGIKPTGADMVITLTSRKAFNVFDPKGYPAPVRAMTDEKGNLFVGAYEAKDGVETIYTLGSAKEGDLYDVAAEFTAPKATTEIKFQFRIGFNKPAPKPAPATPAVATLNWISRPVTVTKEEGKVAELKQGESGYIGITADITVTVHLVSKGPFVVGTTVVNKPDTKGMYVATATWSKSAQTPIKIDIATSPVDVLATLTTGDKAEVRWVYSLDTVKLQSGQNIVLEPTPAPTATPDPGKKADPNATASGLSATGGGDLELNLIQLFVNWLVALFGAAPIFA